MDVEVSVIMPCLNESETLEICIKKAQKAFKNCAINGEVIIADNGSSDGSQDIAVRNGVRLISVKEKGYGSALLGGIKQARGKYIVIGDADQSYDFLEIPGFYKKLQEDYDLVMGNRFKGEIMPGAMPWKNRYIGNPILSGIGRLFFGRTCGDFHCGMRGFTKAAAVKMDLHTTGMEFASEMVIKALLKNMRVGEIPINLNPDGRSRAPHLRPWADGWRHLRFMLLYSPKWLFLYPGIVLMLLGFSLSIWLIHSPLRIGSAILDIHTLLYSSVFVLTGFQAVCFAIFSNIVAVSLKLLPPNRHLEKVLQLITLEKGIGFGAILAFIGLSGSIFAFCLWGNLSYGPLDPSRVLRIVIPSITLFLLGIQTVLASFLISFLRINRRSN